MRGVKNPQNFADIINGSSPVWKIINRLGRLRVEATLAVGGSWGAPNFRLRSEGQTQSGSRLSAGSSISIQSLVSERIFELGQGPATFSRNIFLLTITLIEVRLVHPQDSALLSGRRPRERASIWTRRVS